MVDSYEELPLTPITTVPSDANQTGAWRTFRPIIDQEKCIKCWICWKFCPDVSIKIDSGQPEVDYDHCKGCGICAYECPKDAIRMEKEV
ncbi:MAG: 4Fe-4S binding protein [Candidatus Thermoplasmatota archaeon]|nr:4Fe-4S binding protein [Candidatus Thermoplasmatota archaeon]